MKCVIGIDGGGTKSLLRMVDMERTVLYETLGGGLNLCSTGKQQVKENLEQIVQSAVSYVPGAQIVSICLGAAGVIDDDGIDYLKRILQPYAEYVQVCNDAHIAMYANLKNESGIALTAGTGSILYGRNKSGKVLRVGGWGHLMGDEGSGYQIGLQALKTVAQNYDMQKGESQLLNLLLDYFHCNDFEELVSCVYNEAQDKKQIAALASIVDIAAESGDEDSVKILKKCAGQLYEQCDILIHQLELEAEPFIIVPNGSIIQKSSLVVEEFQTLLKCNYPQAKMKDTLLDSAWGAVELALGQVK